MVFSRWIKFSHFPPVFSAKTEPFLVGHLFYLSSNQQHQSTEGYSKHWSQQAKITHWNHTLFIKHRTSEGGGCFHYAAILHKNHKHVPNDWNMTNISVKSFNRLITNYNISTTKTTYIVVMGGEPPGEPCVEHATYWHQKQKVSSDKNLSSETEMSAIMYTALVVNRVTYYDKYLQASGLCETLWTCLSIQQLSQLAQTLQHTPSEHHSPQSTCTTIIQLCSMKLITM